MNGLAIFILILVLSFLLGSYLTHVPVERNEQFLQDQLTALLIGHTLYDLHNVAPYLDSFDAINHGYYTITLNPDPLAQQIVYLDEYFDEYFRSVKTFLDTKDFPMYDYLYFYTGVYRNLFGSLHDTILEKSISQYRDVPKYSLYFCEHNKTAFSFVFKTFPEMLKDYQWICFKTLKASEVFTRYNHIFNISEAMVDQIKERWALFDYRMKEKYQKDLDEIEKCITINMKFYTSCPLNSLLYSKFRNE